MNKLQKCGLLIHDEKLQRAIVNLDECHADMSDEHDDYYNENLWNIIEESEKDIANYIMPTNEELMETLYDNACAHVANGSWSDFGLRLDHNLNKLIKVNKAESRLKILERLFAEYPDHVYLDEISKLQGELNEFK